MARTMRTDVRYTPSDCFETFPFPDDISSLEGIGERYYALRQSIMLARQEGLTKTYNRFHNPQEAAEDIQQLRGLHVEMDGRWRRPTAGAISPGPRLPPDEAGAALHDQRGGAARGAGAAAAAQPRALCCGGGGGLADERGRTAQARRRREGAAQQGGRGRRRAAAWPRSARCTGRSGCSGSEGAGESLSH